MKRNPLLSSLSEKYLFHEVKTRVDAYKKQNPDARIISLGIGDTTEPLSPHISHALSKIGADLGTVEGYRGYGPELGILELREKIASVLYPHISWLIPQEIFISDGAKCDIGRLQILFGETSPVAVQEPSYPAYFDSSMYVRSEKPQLLSYLPSEKNPPRLQLHTLKPGSLIFLCSPNNPTGTVYSKDELQEYVYRAKEHGHIIVYDVAYREYIRTRDTDLPLSIYEIEGAEKVAIEVGSFSKSCGFSGIRLGWSIVPTALTYNDGNSVNRDFTRLATTIFNGASYISQKAGIEALTPVGRKETAEQIEIYRSNIAALKNALEKKKAIVHGGVHAPYLWVQIRDRTAWAAFDYLLHSAHIVTTPGIGFGPSGENFLRISGFGKPTTIDEAVRRILQLDLG